MNIEDLPAGAAPDALEFGHFPARFQAVIWRNRGLVSLKTLADVLEADEDEIIKAADDMGLGMPREPDPQWLKRGYITIIRANWHLLDYGQLLKLLGWTAEKLAFHLKEDDFLWEKLGSLKPVCPPVKFRRLTGSEAERTARIREAVKRAFYGSRRAEKPFSFVEKLSTPLKSGCSNPGLAESRFGSNFIYSYFAAYGDVLSADEQDPFPEGLLQRYAGIGVGAIWLQAILYMLCPIKEAPEYSAGREKRIENLRALIARAEKYGLKVYLYLNEPRGMLEPFFEKLPSWKGSFSSLNGTYALCTSAPGVLGWLEDACARLFREAPGLGGVLTITMSENLTNCHSKGTGSDCPRCAGRSPHEIVAEVNRAVEKGVRSTAPSARVIAWNWGWKEEWEHEAIDLLPRDMEVMCVSERGKELNIGGVENLVGDYSISCPGPSKRSISIWAHAGKRGMKTVAKVQLNNSWECSALPFLPVPYLVEEHLENVRRAGVEGLMLSWSLGGYPGGNLELLNNTPEELAVINFGSGAAPVITEAWKMFGEAFRNFPFNVAVLYTAPQNMGPANPLFLERTGYKATMVGFPYDDLETWRANYPENVFENQLRMLSEGWRAGLERLLEAEALVEKGKAENFEELRAMAEAGYCHFRSAYNQTRFVRIRDKADSASRARTAEILDEEAELAVKLHGIVMADSRVGFEAANHYAYTANDLMEKVINCVFLKESLNLNE